jgi:hypothetical protein
MSSPYENAEPDLDPLFRALADCRIPAEQIPHVAETLSRPLPSFGLSAKDDPPIFQGKEFVIGTGTEAGPLVLRPREFDHDMAARLLRFDEWHPDSDANWKSLTRAERKRAERLWDRIGKAHGLSVTPKGRPPVIDPALVLYCIRVLCEASERSSFRFSRVNGAYTGPMWRALIEALQLAQPYLAYRFGTPALGRVSTKRHDHRVSSHLDAIAEIVRVIRSKQFHDLCVRFGLGPSADDVANNPSMFRVVIAYARSRKGRLRARF